MTLGAAAAAGVRLIVWYKACGRQVEPDPAEMVRQYGAETAFIALPFLALCGVLDCLGIPAVHRTKIRVIFSHPGSSTGRTSK